MRWGPLQIQSGDDIYIKTWSNSSWQIAACLKRWLTHIFYTNWFKLFTDWRSLEIIGPRKCWSLDHFEITSKLLQAVVRPSCSTTSTIDNQYQPISTNQVPQTPGPLVQAPLSEALPTHLNTNSCNPTQSHGPIRFIKICMEKNHFCIKGTFIRISSHCPFLPFCCPKEDPKDDAYYHQEPLHKHAQIKSIRNNYCPSQKLLPPALQ